MWSRGLRAILAVTPLVFDADAAWCREPGKKVWRVELGHPVVLLRARTSDSLTVTASHASGVAAHSQMGAGNVDAGWMRWNG
jgi:hypothetical protein